VGARGRRPDSECGISRSQVADTSWALNGTPHPIAESRTLASWQDLIGDLLASVRDDLRRPPTCARHGLALAWTNGAWPCGCAYESTELAIEQVAEMVGERVELLRARILRSAGVTFRACLVQSQAQRRRGRSADPRQLELPGVAA
jgi:hypothetical protein